MSNSSTYNLLVDYAGDQLEKQDNGDHDLQTMNAIEATKWIGNYLAKDSGRTVYDKDFLTELAQMILKYQKTGDKHLHKLFLQNLRTQGMQT